MSAPEQPSGSLAGPLRWLGRSVVVAAGLWFIADGLREQWTAAGAVATALVVIGVALAVAFAVVGSIHLGRRGREG